MIADKIVHCYYSVELRGDLIEKTLSDMGLAYGVDSLKFCSNNFANDLEAMAGMQAALESISLFAKIDIDRLEVTEKFNPDFFPSLDPIPLTLEQKLEVEESEMLAEEASEAIAEQQKIAITFTKNFDPMGDNVQCVIDAKTDGLEMVAKVHTEMDDYMQIKAQNIVNVKDQAFIFKTLPQVSIH